MNEDYLWDKSGKPDPEIQDLEEILGTLRYQPRELEIPPQLETRHKSFMVRGLAIAAAVALLVLGAGIWMNLRQEKPDDSNQAAAPAVDEKKRTNLQATAPAPVVPPSVPTVSHLPRTSPLAGNRRRPSKVRRPSLSESEIVEAKNAKDQLMIALRLASSKLSMAQKKTQGNPANEIHNQHKAG